MIISGLNYAVLGTRVETVSHCPDCRRFLQRNTEKLTSMPRPSLCYTSKFCSSLVCSRLGLTSCFVLVLSYPATRFTWHSVCSSWGSSPFPPIYNHHYLAETAETDLP